MAGPSTEEESDRHRNNRVSTGTGRLSSRRLSAALRADYGGPSPRVSHAVEGRFREVDFNQPSPMRKMSSLHNETTFVDEDAGDDDEVFQINRTLKRDGSCTSSVYDGMTTLQKVFGGVV